MIKYTNKLSFHIPGFKYINGKMLNVYIDDFIKLLTKELELIGIKAFYTTPATGYYKGRSYKQEIITVFYDKEDKEVLGCFVRTVRTMREQLEQESYAYELNGKMFVFDAEEFCNLA